MDGPQQEIGQVVRKFEQTGSVVDIVTPVHHRNVRSTENIAAVAASVEEDPNVSIPRRAQQLGLSNTSLWRILHLDLHLHPYKVQLVQKLERGDHGMRRAYVDWVNEQQQQNAEFLHHIFFSDKAHFDKHPKFPNMGLRKSTRDC